MTYDASEIGVKTGKPIELYEFTVGVTSTRYTSGPETVTYLVNEYTPEKIERDDIELTDNAFKNELKIKIDRENILFRPFISAPIDDIITLTIFRGHGTDFITFWTGVVAQVMFNSDEITVMLQPKTSGLSRTGVRRKYQKLCAYDLYGLGCLVNDLSFRVNSTIAIVNGTTITAAIFATEANGYFTAGKFTVGDAERLITSHTGSVITINRAIPDAVAGNAFFAFAGCDHTKATCISKFNNVVNHGGQPWIPRKNPFSGDAVI